VLAHDAVYPLDPAAAVPGESVGFGRAYVFLRLPCVDESVVEIDRDVAAGEENLRRDRGREAYAQD